jgi:hypothetical protein
MDKHFIDETNKLLLECDREQAAFEEARVAKQPEPELEPAMTRAEVKVMLGEAMDMLADGLGAETGALERKLRAELRAEFEAKLGELRAELSVSGAHDRVLDFGKWKNDAAA